MKTLHDIQPGQTVGRYEFLVPVGQGGMAAVWLARLRGSRGFNKTVAVKTMLPTVSDEPQFEEMFLDEARIASRIRHPNVVEILDLGEQDEVLYLVMEWVDGEPLSSVRWVAAKQQGIPIPIGVKIVAEACAGLHAAHELRDEFGESVGLVHRDISPQNILIGYDGVVKLVDFGVAKAAGRTAQNTTVGEVKGKPPYMSPEQALGMFVDRRTDVFALGIVLYQLTTGKHPLRGETDVVTLQNIISDRPITPPSAVAKDLPWELEAVIMRALERDPERRYQTASAMGAALDDLFLGPLPRVRTDDVGKFVQQLLGDRGEERRAELRAAIRLADERAFGAQTVRRPTVGRASATSATELTRPELPSLSADAGSELTAVTGGQRGSSDFTPLPRFRQRSWVPWLAPAVVVLGVAVFLLVGQPRSLPVAATAASGAPKPSDETTSTEPASEHRPAIEPRAAQSQRGGLPGEGGAGAAAADAGTEAQPVKQSTSASRRRQRSAPTPMTSATVPPNRFRPPPVPNPGF